MLEIFGMDFLWVKSVVNSSTTILALVSRCSTFYSLKISQVASKEAILEKALWENSIIGDSATTATAIKSEWNQILTESTHVAILSRENNYEKEQSQLTGIFTCCKPRCHCLPVSQTLRRKTWKTHQRERLVAQKSSHLMTLMVLQKKIKIKIG